MSVIEQKTVTISLLNEDGLGVTSDGKVKVPFVLPSEIIKYSKHSYRKKTNFTLDEVLEFSSKRVTPSCKYFTICGGCKLQHANQELYNTYKTNLIYQEIYGFSPNTTINPLVTIQPHSRRRLQMPFVKKDGKIFMGFQKLNSHKIVDIDDCYIADVGLVELFEPLRNLLTSVFLDFTNGELYLLKADNGVAIEIKISKGDFSVENYEEVIKLFSSHYQIVEIIVSFADVNRVLSYVKTPAKISFAGIDVKVNARCFLQSSKFSDDFLAKEVIKYVSQIYPNKSKSDLKIADLFCGRGTLTIPLSNYGMVYGYEFDDGAIKALGEAIRLNSLNVRLGERDLFSFPLFSEELNKFDILVMNPPRAGAIAQVREIVKSKVEYLIYVSCNPKTFAIDARELNKNGYMLEQLTPFDQFLYSNHLEIIGFFKKV